MLKLFRFIVPILFISINNLAQVPHDPVNQHDEQAVKTILEQYQTAWLNNDEEGILSLFEKEARIQPSGICPVDSIQNIKQFWFPKDGSITTIHQFDIEVQNLYALGNNMIYGTWTNRLYWSYHFKESQMGRLQYGYGTGVFRRQGDGNWKIWRQSWTDLKSVTTSAIEPGMKPLNVAYDIPENDLVPEGIAYDEVTGDLYIGSTWKRKILKISPEGKISEFIKSGKDGFLGAIGMKVDAKRRHLWVASSSAGSGMPVQGLTDVTVNKSALFKFDLNTGTCLKQYWLDDGKHSYFLNDLTIDQNGRVYATEMRTKSIYTLAPNSDQLELFFTFPDGAPANGIDLDSKEENLFLARYTKPNSFSKLNLKTKTLHSLELPPDEKVGADGLYFYQNSLIAVQPGRKDREVTRYFLDDAQTKVVDIQVLLADDPNLAQPTTGALAGEKFYFIATSQLQAFAKHWKENNGVVNPKQLKSIKIGVLKL